MHTRYSRWIYICYYLLARETNVKLNSQIKRPIFLNDIFDSAATCPPTLTRWCRGHTFRHHQSQRSCVMAVMNNLTLVVYPGLHLSSSFVQIVDECLYPELSYSPAVSIAGLYSWEPFCQFITTVQCQRPVVLCTIARHDTHREKKTRDRQAALYPPSRWGGGGKGVELTHGRDPAAGELIEIDGLSSFAMNHLLVTCTVFNYSTGARVNTMC